MILVVVPVLNRPDNAQPLFKSVTDATTLPHRVMFVVTHTDVPEQEAVIATGADMLLVPWEPGPGDWARKINQAFKLSDEPWILLGADDLRFHPGWDVAAMAVAEKTLAGVVGTNDLGNPRVVRGRHSTHPLVRRAYVETLGGVWHEPGTVLHEGYDHQFSDDELVETARARRTWAFARDSVVEHLHPYFGKSPMDATYEKALRHTKEDAALFRRRRRRLWQTRRR